MTIDFAEISPQYTPDVQIETSWSGASATLPQTTKKVCLLGNNLATGSEPVPTGTTVSTVKRITSEAQAISLYGKGSNLAVMVRAALAVTPKLELYASPYKQGSGAAKAACDTPFTVTATGNGTLYVFVAGETFSCGVATGDTPAVLLAKIVAVINGHPNLPVVASVASTTHLKLEALNPGACGNTIGFKLKITAGIGSVFQTPGMSGAGTESAGEYLTAGATDGDPTVQLAAMEGTRYHLIVLDTADTTAGAALKTHVNKVAAPNYKLWGMALQCFNGTLANCETLANARDAYRYQVGFGQYCPQSVAQMAGIFAATRGRRDAKWSCIDDELVGMAQPYDPTNALNPAQIEEAITEGITPFRADEYGGTMSIVRSVTTRQTATIAFRDHVIQEKSDYFDESLIQALSVYKGKTLKVRGDAGSNSTVTLPRLLAAAVRTIKKLDRGDYVQGTADAMKAGANFFEVNATDPTRVDGALRFDPTQVLAFLAIQKLYYTGE